MIKLNKRIKRGIMEIFTFYAVGISLSVFALYFFGVAVAPYVPDKVKNDYFECGLPVSSSMPKKMNFGFFVYAIMFIVVDMTGLFLTLFVYATSSRAKIIAAIFTIIISVAVSIAMKELNTNKRSA